MRKLKNQDIFEGPAPVNENGVVPYGTDVTVADVLATSATQGLATIKRDGQEQAVIVQKINSWQWVSRKSIKE